jgi:hypothetical protein
MTKKLTLELDALSVDSFPTSGVPAPPRGTVRGADDDCTCAYSCLCPTNAYYCATAPATVVSCTYTNNVSCQYDSYNVSCGCTQAGCPSYPVCVGSDEC